MHPAADVQLVRSGLRWSSRAAGRVRVRSGQCDLPRVPDTPSACTPQLVGVACEPPSSRHIRARIPGADVPAKPRGASSSSDSHSELRWPRLAQEGRRPAWVMSVSMGFQLEGCYLNSEPGMTLGMEVQGGTMPVSGL